MPVFFLFAALVSLNSNAKSCDLYLTHCGTQCSNGWGYMCFWGTSCNPLSHRCEKNEPKFDTADRRHELGKEDRRINSNAIKSRSGYKSE